MGSELDACKDCGDADVVVPNTESQKEKNIPPTEIDEEDLPEEIVETKGKVTKLYDIPHKHGGNFINMMVITTDKKLFTAGGDGNINGFTFNEKTKEFEFENSFDNPTKPVWVVNYKRGRNYLYAGTNNGELKKYDTNTYKLIKSIKAFNGGIQQITETNDGRVIVISNDSTFKVFDENLEEIKVLDPGLGNGIYQAIMLKKNILFTTGQNNKAVFFDMNDYKRLDELTINNVFPSLNNSTYYDETRNLLYIGGFKGEITVIDSKNLKLVKSVKCEELKGKQISGILRLYDNELLVTVRASPSNIYKLDNNLEYKETITTPRNSSQIQCICMIRGMNQFITGTEGSCWVWEY